MALAVAVGLTACSTQPGGIINTRDLTKDESYFIGARQRAILNSPVGPGSRPGLVNPERVVCAEPSPDVALAIAQASGAGLSFLGGGGQGALSGTAATTEGVGQLGERTQAIQLLRDQMYRACEAYSNGAITGTTYNLIMSKNNDAMVTLMMAGLAAGEFGRAGLAIGGSASSEASASVSSLLDTMQAADEAADELKKAEDEEAAAEEKLENAEANAEADAAAADAAAAAAGPEGQSEEQEEQQEEQQAENEAAVEEAEDEVAKARENVRKKRERKNDADSKARAEITKVIGAGSITAKGGVGVAQVLAQMQDQFLREDFADEYVAACIVELGVADASSPEFAAGQARGLAVTQAWLFDGFIENDVTQQSLRAHAFVDYLQRIQGVKATERYSLLARHCQEKLYDFVLFARRGEMMIEQQKIRLDARRIEQQGDQVRKETLEAFKQVMEHCDKIEDPAPKGKCLQSAATIVERPGGVFELVEVPTIEVPTGKAPRPVIPFDKAVEAKTDFDAEQAKLGTEALPALDPATVSPEDGERLSRALASLTQQNNELKKDVAKLKDRADNKLTTDEKDRLVAEQNKRPGLVDKVELTAGADDDEKSIAADELALHDKKMKKEIKDLRELGKKLTSATKKIKAHLGAIAVLKQQIANAVAAKAAGG